MNACRAMLLVKEDKTVFEADAKAVSGQQCYSGVAPLAGTAIDLYRLEVLHMYVPAGPDQG